MGTNSSKAGDEDRLLNSFLWISNLFEPEISFPNTSDPFQLSQLVPGSMNTFWWSNRMKHIYLHFYKLNEHIFYEVILWDSSLRSSLYKRVNKCQLWPNATGTSLWLLLELKNIILFESYAIGYRVPISMKYENNFSLTEIPYILVKKYYNIFFCRYVLSLWWFLESLANMLVHLNIYYTPIKLTMELIISVQNNIFH